VASWQISHSGFLNFTALKPLRGNGGTNDSATVGLTFNYRLGDRESASMNATHQRGDSDEQIEVQRSLPAGTGYGYHVTADHSTSESVDAEVTYQDSHGTYDLHTIKAESTLSVAAEANGGIVFLDRSLFATRRLDQSFAIVKVGDYAGVQVYADNQVVAVTGQDGTALVPHIRPYEVNPLHIDQANLPLDAEIDSLERDAVPYRRSGVLVKFDVQPSLGALIALVQADGSAVPPGAVVQVDQRDAEFPVGQRGDTYVTGLSQTSNLHVTWPGHACDTPVQFTPSSDPVPHLGPLLCTGAAP